MHLYWKVDNAQVHRVIREDVRNFDGCLESLGRYLEADVR